MPATIQECQFCLKRFTFDPTKRFSAKKFCSKQCSDGESKGIGVSIPPMPEKEYAAMKRRYISARLEGISDEVLSERFGGTAETNRRLRDWAAEIPAEKKKDLARHRGGILTATEAHKCGYYKTYIWPGDLQFGKSFRNRMKYYKERYSPRLDGVDAVDGSGSSYVVRGA